MAPEQIGNQYENEVDIYSLGIIIFELFWVFGTGHERVKEWYDIREAKLPNDFEAQYRTESSLIKSMLSKNPLKRPKASTLKDYLANTDILCSRTY
ncbi:eukaryotic translation initiation factor 2-alpha kinase 3-like [Bombina bombina]|uniref:eukaryotic translation initiation factor 2-alpha kinase 3-like n=1 Tax=Bombina bombina TaxID=8345 RepID=UPI00235ACBB9|nr:eukaryotic translation initiation factor 2-alpha kinase 3-like [Bombina bombina]